MRNDFMVLAEQISARWPVPRGCEGVIVKSLLAEVLEQSPELKRIDGELLARASARFGGELFAALVAHRTVNETEFVA